MQSETLDVENVERPRGILSEADRKYLLADEDERETNYSRQARGLRDRKIRERFHNAFRDFQILQSELDPGQRKRIFEMSREVEEDISTLLMFLYVGLDGQPLFGRLVQNAVANGEVELGHAEDSLLVSVSSLDVQVRTEKDFPTLAADALDRLEAGERLTDLNDPELYAVARYLDLGGGIDTSGVRATLEHVNDLHEPAGE